LFNCAGVAVLPDTAHSNREQRFRAVGHMQRGRVIFCRVIPTLDEADSSGIPKRPEL
jgi:uncharacterized DUF497 family protein